MEYSVVIIALEYLEPEFTHTKQCLEKFNVPIIWAKRDGVGNMSRAFNEAFLYKLKGNPSFSILPRYTWFTTNIICNEFLLPELVKGMESTGFAAIHPSFKSVHRRIIPDGSGIVKEVPFIEFTAPIFRTEVFEKYYLDEDLWYWWMDVDISYKMKRDGYKLGVHHGASLTHSYLAEDKHNEISKIRYQMRTMMNREGEHKMKTIYGPDWKAKLLCFNQQV
jgi:GT2 family glycosyltransferase